MGRTANFQVDPRLANVLGESYRSTEHALKELVDNAWDAEAENVWITLPEPVTSDPIIIRDDGTGMTDRELEHEYLFIANDRRSRKGDRTHRKNRQVKGRKGIGKFAGLVAADIMTLETRARGKRTRLTIKKSDLLEARKDLEKIDLPLETETCNSEEHGTTITLSGLSQKLAYPDADKLRQLLMMEYGREEDFTIYVNGDPLEVEDIPGANFDDEEDLPGIGPVKLKFVVAEGKGRLKNPGIVVRIGGKVVGKPGFFGLEEAEDIPPKLLRKIYGEIVADGLAEDVTADWGAVIENSLSFQAVARWVAPKLRRGLESVYRKEVSLARARLQQRINRRLEQLPEYRRNFAKLAVERVLLKFYGESEERIWVVAEVVLDALERDEYWAVVQKIEQAKSRDVETLAEALESFGLVDLAVMGQQAHRRLVFLDELDALISNPATLEKQVHTALERNLWIFGPEYMLLSSNKTLARVIKEYTDKEFSGDRAKKRPDLFLADNFAGKYLLIEFKRPSEILTRDHENQARKYRDDLTHQFSPMDILVLGKGRDPQIPANYDQEDVKLLSYSALVSKARAQYQWMLREIRSETEVHQPA